MAAAVAIASSKIWSHLLNAKLLVNITFPRSYRSANSKRKKTSATVLKIVNYETKYFVFWNKVIRGSAPEPPRFFQDRGRDGCCRPPPAQIRTRAFNSYGSCLESDAESNTGKWVDRFGQREVACDDPHEARPSHAVTLTPATKLGKPELLHFIEELR